MSRKLKRFLGIRSPSDVWIAYLNGYSSLVDYENKKAQRDKGKKEWE